MKSAESSSVGGAVSTTGGDVSASYSATTRIDTTYYANGTKYGQAWTLSEKDYS